MTTACPYCGAALNLNYCVVCGRQSDRSLNKMGSLKTVARNTDVTQRLEDPLETKKYRYQQAVIRLAKAIKNIFKVGLSIFIVGVLIWAASHQASQIMQMQNSVAPWMKSHRFAIPNPNLSALKDSIVRATQLNSSKQKSHLEKHRSRAENSRSKAK